jgi:hypothetical protein
MMAGGGGSPLQGMGPAMANAITLAKKTGFSGLALVTIVSIDRSSGAFSMTQSDYSAAWLKTKGGKDFTSYGSQYTDWPNYKSTSCSASPAFLAFALPVANTSGVSVPGQWNNLVGCSQNQNIPGGGLINNATDFFSGGSFDIKRITTGIFGGILIVIGLMMFIKQLTGVSITGVGGKVGKVLAL